MPVTTYTHGQNTRVYVDGWDLSGYLNSSNTPTNREEHETTVFNSGYDKTYQGGNWDGTVELGGFWKDTTLEPIQTVLINATVATAFPAGTALNSPARLAAVTGTKDENPSDAGDIIGQTATLRALSGIGRGRSLRAPGVVGSGAGTGTVVDFTVDSLIKWMANIHLTALNAGTFDATLKHSADNITFVTAGTFPQLTAIGGAHIEGVGTLYRYRRIDWSVGGGGTSANFVAAVSGR